MATYPYDISSIQTKNPDMPNVLGNINLNQTIEEGQALNRQDAREGKVTATALRALKGK